MVATNRNLEEEVLAGRYGKEALDLTQKDRDVLSEYHWPGNIRELKNVIERAVTLSSDDRL